MNFLWSSLQSGAAWGFAVALAPMGRRAAPLRVDVREVGDLGHPVAVPLAGRAQLHQQRRRRLRPVRHQHLRRRSEFWDTVLSMPVMLSWRTALLMEAHNDEKLLCPQAQSGSAPWNRCIHRLH